MSEPKAKKVYWSQLKSADEHTHYKRLCPFCDGGILPVRRDRDSMELEEFDRCFGCGQLVQYMDIEKIRKSERGG